MHPTRRSQDDINPNLPVQAAPENQGAQDVQAASVIPQIGALHNIGEQPGFIQGAKLTLRRQEYPQPESSRLSDSRFRYFVLPQSGSVLAPPEMPQEDLVTLSSAEQASNRLSTPETTAPQANVSTGLGFFANASLSVGDGVLQMLPASGNDTFHISERNSVYQVSRMAMPSAVIGGMTSMVGEIYTTGSTSMALSNIFGAHTTVVQGTMRNTLFGNATAYDRENTYYQSGIRMQMRDGLSTVSAMSEISLTADAQSNMLGFARLFEFFGLRIHGLQGIRTELPPLSYLKTMNVDASVSVQWNRIQLWDSGALRSYRVQGIAALLAAGQGIGQAIGGMIGANMLLPALGASVGGYVSGILTSSMISYFSPPNQTITTPLNSLNINLPQVSLTSRAHVGMNYFYEGALRTGFRYSRERRLPQDLILERRLEEEARAERLNASQRLLEQAFEGAVLQTTPVDLSPEGVTDHIAAVEETRLSMAAIIKELDEASPMDQVQAPLAPAQEATAQERDTAVDPDEDDNNETDRARRRHPRVNFGSEQSQLRRRRR